MKALIRNEGETITEQMNIKGINWVTGYPFTDLEWAGGPYKLIEDYNPPEIAVEISEETP